MTFEIIDKESGNSVAAFDSQDEATEYLASTVKDDPAEADVLVLMGFDEAGQAVKTWAAKELF